MDLIRIAAEKKALQQRLKQNIIVAAKKKPATSKYVFEMLNTDDETDDESNPKPGRPTPPDWSLRKHSTLARDLVVVFFSTRSFQ